MRRIGLRLGIALITFCLGVGASWVALLISQPPRVAIESPSLSEIIMFPALETPSAIPPKLATIVFIRSYKNRYGLILASFKVTNISNEPLYYAGDASTPNWNRYYSVRRGIELSESDRNCGTGLVEHPLLPGKSVKFEVVAGEQPGRVQVGFDFFIGENRLKQTIWSDEVYVSE